MSVETIRMSSKGQVVIPQDIRDDLRVGEGTLFAVIGSKDSIVLKRIETPSKAELLKDLENIAKEGKNRLQAKGINEVDFLKIIEKRRKAK